MNPLAQSALESSISLLESSISPSRLEDDDWVIVQPDEGEVQDAKPVGINKESYGEWILNNRYLEVAVFGSKECRMGHPSEHWAQAHLQAGQDYLSKTEYESVSVPLTEKSSLSCAFFGRYDATAHVLPFDADCLTCVVFSGAFLPCRAYIMGIVEGYRQEGVQVLALDYVGFGDNIELGSPTPTSVYNTAEACVKYLLGRGIREDGLILHGYSLGGFPAVKMSAKYRAHLVLDRAPVSTKAVADDVLRQRHTQSRIYNFAATCLSNLAQYGAPFSIEGDIVRVRRKIFVAQEAAHSTSDVGALLLVQTLQSKYTLQASTVTLHTIPTQHITSPAYTWTVDGNTYTQKFGGSFFTSYYSEPARQAWKLFIQEIRALKV